MGYPPLVTYVRRLSGQEIYYENTRIDFIKNILYFRNRKGVRNHKLTHSKRKALQAYAMF